MLSVFEVREHAIREQRGLFNAMKVHRMVFIILSLDIGSKLQTIYLQDQTSCEQWPSRDAYMSV